MAITECCDLNTYVPLVSMNEVLTRDQPYGHYWMLWLEDRCSIGIDEWSTTPALVPWPFLNVVTWSQMFHGHRWMKCYPGTSPMVITECFDLETADVPWASIWMKCYPGTSPMAITECCDWDMKHQWNDAKSILFSEAEEFKENLPIFAGIGEFLDAPRVRITLGKSNISRKINGYLRHDVVGCAFGHRVVYTCV
jgi:hypothetical protein